MNFSNLTAEQQKNNKKSTEKTSEKINETKLIEHDDKCYNIDKYYTKTSEIAIPIINRIKDEISNIERMLYAAPSFLSTIKAMVPDDVYQAVLSGEQKRKLATGTLELMTKKDGTLIANLINPKTKKIVSKVNLEKIKISPEYNQAMVNYSTQVQLAQIAEEIKYVQLAIEEVRQGQENDRLAIAYSCKQKLFQAMAINNPNTRMLALMNLVASAEDSRNALMLSQNVNIQFIKTQPEKFFSKLFNGAKDEEISIRMNEIRENLNALNMVSLIETIAYQEMGEENAAKLSLQYYGEYINKTYLTTPHLIQRLDNIDPSPKQYWSKTLPNIFKKVNSLTSNIDAKLLKEKDDED